MSQTLMWIINFYMYNLRKLLSESCDAESLSKRYKSPRPWPKAYKYDVTINDLIHDWYCFCLLSVSNEPKVCLTEECVRTGKSLHASLSLPLPPPPPSLSEQRETVCSLLSSRKVYAVNFGIEYKYIDRRRTRNEQFTSRCDQRIDFRVVILENNNSNLSY